ncbi:competence type IV pilus minor pilin ComGG [Streptococcus entericus]|uniref:competence type IV pilus minor pilin ComGG n=1 Tax=Streptococcus entericus TaxID=155680 RepID=UPI00037398DD|nr:competence type IV pilus minor pilin ComGG [Streptococcus entericus]
MLLTKRLKAGILLYALFMAAVFALLLQFYISRVQVTAQLQSQQYQQAQASLMAELTKELADKASGSYQFAQGSTSYTHQSNYLVVSVNLSQGNTYHYRFFKLELPDKKDSKETPKENDKEVTAVLNDSDQSIDKVESIKETEVDASTSV